MINRINIMRNMRDKTFNLLFVLINSKKEEETDEIQTKLTLKVSSIIYHIMFC